MAIFQLGSIVTAIKGSIGGTAFKTQRGTNVMYKKSNGFSKSRQLVNQALVYSRWIFTNWSFLTPEQKEGWAALAATLLFPDKFGNQVHITGRQLYTKVNLNLQQNEYYATVPEGFTTLIPLVTLSDAFFDKTAGTAGLTAVIQDTFECYVFVSAQVSVNPLAAPVFIRRFTLTEGLNSGTVNLEFGDAFFKQFPYVNSNYNVRYYVDIVNIYGIKGTPLYIDVATIPASYSFSLTQAVQQVDGSVSLNTTASWGGDNPVRVWAQPAVIGTATPDFSEAVLVGDYVTTLEHYSMLQWILFTAPWLLDEGTNMIVWAALQDPDDIWLEPQSINLVGEFAQPSSYITLASFSLYFLPSGHTDYLILNNPLLIPAETSDTVIMPVQFANWLTGDPVPDADFVMINSSVFGTVSATSVFSSVMWIEGSKVLLFENIDPAWQISHTIDMPLQVVNTVP